jgi:hypothetical protein
MSIDKIRMFIADNPRFIEISKRAIEYKENHVKRCLII